MPRKKTVKEELLLDDKDVIKKELANCYKLHSGQDILYEQVFVHIKKRIFAQCGRNWGKSVSIAKIMADYACLNPNSACFIICPEKTQAMEIYWSSGLLRSMIPAKYISKNFLNRDEYVKSELRIRLTNGSFIKLLGADDPDALRGIKPNICAYDEYRDFKSDVYWSMEANLAGKNATLIIGSTPPDVTGHYSELRSHFISEIKGNNERYYYLELPTETNPHIDRDTLADIKRRLIAHGQIRVWEREYMAKFIPGGASSVFPMFADNKDLICRDSSVIREIIKPDKDILEYYAIFDPAASSVFAVLIAAINKFTGQVFLLDELYERDRAKTSSIDMWRRTNEKKQIYFKKLDKWENHYDEHESWFLRDLERYEVLSYEGTNLEPTSKQSRDKQEDLTIIKDLMLLKNRLFIAQDKCVNLINEIEGYATDKEGKLVKKRDHQIDNFRYLLAASGFTPNEVPNYDEYLMRKQESKVMVQGFETYILNQRKQKDWTSEIDEGSVFTDEVVFLEDMNYAELF